MVAWDLEGHGLLETGNIFSTDCARLLSQHSWITCNGNHRITLNRCYACDSLQGTLTRIHIGHIYTCNADTEKFGACDHWQGLYLFHDFLHINIFLEGEKKLPCRCHVAVTSIVLIGIEPLWLLGLLDVLFPTTTFDAQNAQYQRCCYCNWNERIGTQSGCKETRRIPCRDYLWPRVHLLKAGRLLFLYFDICNWHLWNRNLWNCNLWNWHGWSCLLWSLRNISLL
mmetsp:Transcript_12382/g.23312  ORF Transcript_12382/g.23312 Transcript_12382/m.23312 type:complete len:226 (-) Transcript_12382:138-815(-)